MPLAISYARFTLVNQERPASLSSSSSRLPPLIYWREREREKEKKREREKEEKADERERHTESKGDREGQLQNTIGTFIHKYHTLHRLYHIHTSPIHTIINTP